MQRDDPAPDDGHQETVNADALMFSEVQKDQVDQMLERVGTFDPAVDKADDLQKLNGVGPLLEQKLHQLGIYKYDQVSKLTASDYQLLDSIIDTFPVQDISKEWNAQANELKNKN